jgi:hypothetical protein
VESRLLLDVVVAECATIFELLSSKDETLLVGGNTDHNINLCSTKYIIKRTPPYPEFLP